MTGFSFRVPAGATVTIVPNGMLKEEVKSIAHKYKPTSEIVDPTWNDIVARDRYIDKLEAVLEMADGLLGDKNGG